MIMLRDKNETSTKSVVNTLCKIVGFIETIFQTLTINEQAVAQVKANTSMDAI